MKSVNVVYDNQEVGDNLDSLVNDEGYGVIEVESLLFAFENKVKDSISLDEIGIKLGGNHYGSNSQPQGYSVSYGKARFLCYEESDRFTRTVVVIQITLY